MEERLPGVTLWWTACVIKGTSNNKTAIITLDCTIRDEEIWKVVEEKLKAGFRVYSTNDFKTEMITILNEELEVEKVKVREQLRRIGQLEYEKAKLQVEVDKARVFMQGFQELLGPSSPST